MIEIKPSLKKITMIESQICWAACIEMVFGNRVSQGKNGLQEKLKVRLNHFIRERHNNSTESITMPLNENYFVKLFDDDVLNKIGCTQYQSATFPDKNFIIEKIRYNSSIIFSGIYYPVLNTKTLHTIVVEGCKIVNNKFWILALDPRSVNGTRKVAFVYGSLLYLHQKISDNAINKIDFVTNPVTNFGIEAEKFIPEDFPQFPVLKTYDGKNLKNAESIKAFSDDIEFQKAELYRNYFGIEPYKSISFGDEGYYSKNYESFDLILGIDTPEKTYLHPIFVDDEVALEFIFYENNQNEVIFLGIQEATGTQKIEFIEIRNEKLSLNHKNPNYEIVSFKYRENTIDFFRIEVENEQYLFSPIEDIGALKKGSGYDYQKIKHYFSL
jgi:hypothetical protein